MRQSCLYMLILLESLFSRSRSRGRRRSGEEVSSKENERGTACVEQCEGALEVQDAKDEAEELAHGCSECTDEGAHGGRSIVHASETNALSQHIQEAEPPEPWHFNTKYYEGSASVP